MMGYQRILKIAGVQDTRQKESGAGSFLNDATSYVDESAQSFGKWLRGGNTSKDDVFQSMTKGSDESQMAFNKRQKETLRDFDAESFNKVRNRALGYGVPVGGLGLGVGGYEMMDQDRPKSFIEKTQYSLGL